jgi:hypothetical protein
MGFCGATYNAKQRGSAMAWTRYKFAAALERRGFRRLGSGWFAAVYHKPGSDKVIKVGSCTDQWPQYIEWATRRGYGGTFAPRVTSFRSFKSDKGACFSFYVAVMEKLEMTVKRACDNYEEGAFGKAAIERHKSILNRPYSCCGRDVSFKGIEKVAAVDPTLKPFVLGLYGLISHGMQFDAHQENWMVRKDGSLVLTDPFGGSSTSDSANERLNKVSASVRKTSRARIAA